MNNPYHLENVCHACFGKKYIVINDLLHPCKVCKASGNYPSDFGNEIIKFIIKYKSEIEKPE